MKRIQFSLSLPRWHEWLVYLTAGLLTLTGVAWLILDRFGKIEGEFGPEQNPILPWLLMAHGVLAYSFLVVAAMLLPVHVRLGWNAGRNRNSGLLLISIGFVLAVSGLGLYYLSAEGVRAFTSTAHWLIGLVLPIGLIVHVLRGKGGRPKPARP
ncbi:MAG TPA: hypothetical protein VFK19_12415 [Sphingomicrobium sp.]|nr:hypothetical protein [Sphingomicrobium sp.]